MNRTVLLGLVVVVSGLLALQGVCGEAEHRIGAGAQYWYTIDNVDAQDFNEDGLSWIVTYQYKPVGLFKLQADLEYFPEDFKDSGDAVWAPQGYLVVGETLYAAAGAGIYYRDGEWSEDLFYVLRAGIDLEVLPSVHLDVNANYRFFDWDSLSEDDEDIDTDTVVLGAAVRFAF